jgi:hypothetical protein
MTTRSQTTIRVSPLENRSLTLSVNAAAVASAARREEGEELDEGAWCEKKLPKKQRNKEKKKG